MNSSIIVTITYILSSISNLQSMWPSYSTPSSFSGCERVSSTLYPQVNVRNEPFPWEKRERHQFHFLQEEIGAQKGQLVWQRSHSWAVRRTSPCLHSIFEWLMLYLDSISETGWSVFVFFQSTEAEPSSRQSIFQDLGCWAPLDPKAACLTPNA